MNPAQVEPVTEEVFWRRCHCLLLTLMSCGNIVTHAGQWLGFSYAMVLMDKTKGWHVETDSDEGGDITCAIGSLFVALLEGDEKQIGLPLTAMAEGGGLSVT